MNLTGVDASAVVCVVFDQIAVALDLALDGRRGLAEFLSCAADRMTVIQAIFDLGAVRKSKVGSFARR